MCDLNFHENVITWNHVKRDIRVYFKRESSFHSVDIAVVEAGGSASISNVLDSGNWKVYDF